MTADRILFIRARGPQRTTKVALGVAKKHRDGWRFMPLTTSHGPSRKGHGTWEKALPRWTGGLDGTESIGMKPGETIADALARFNEVPEFAA